MDHQEIKKKWNEVDSLFNEFLILYKKGAIKMDDELKSISSKLKKTFIKIKESYSLIMLEAEEEKINNDYKLHKRHNDFLEIYEHFKYARQKS
ncbi:MAG: hypothetical protein K9M80_00030 [Candidatus Marinimicrobia bacterium]|nr:hypothetical protein [Candidatus Neomarinimicrobiota bacterium]